MQGRINIQIKSKCFTLLGYSDIFGKKLKFTMIEQITLDVMMSNLTPLEPLYPAYRFDKEKDPTCPTCVGGMGACAIGTCRECKQYGTASCSSVYCHPCALKMNKCDWCGQPFKNAREYLAVLLKRNQDNIERTKKDDYWSEEDKKGFVKNYEDQVPELKELFDKDIKAEDMPSYMHSIRGKFHGAR